MLVGNGFKISAGIEYQIGPLCSTEPLSNKEPSDSKKNLIPKSKTMVGVEKHGL